MQTIEHILCLLLACEGDTKFFDEHLASFLLPDAIRMYSKNREYSHFEKSPDGKDCSYMKYPTDMKTLSLESVQEALAKDSHLVEHAPCVIGEETDIAMFDSTNKHLPLQMKLGIFCHLAQDIEFDTFIRDVFDCERKYEDIFTSPTGEDIDGKTCRKLIADIETQLSYVLAKQVYDELGIVCNQAWFEKNVYPTLLRDYPTELADNTYKYMRFNLAIDEAISKQDWSLVEAPVAGIPYDDYQTISERAVFVTHYLKEISNGR